MPEFLRPNVADEVIGAVRVPVRMAVEARDALARLRRTPVRRRVELLLREWREQQAQAFELLRIQDAAESLVVVRERDELALRHVAEIRPRRQIDRRGRLREQVLGRHEIQIEARQVAAFLLFHQIDVRLWKHHAAFGMILMRQRQEAGRIDIALANLGGRQRGESVPRHAFRQLHAHAGLHRLAAGHLHGRGRLVREVVAILEQLAMRGVDLVLVGLHALLHCFEGHAVDDVRI